MQFGRGRGIRFEAATVIAHFEGVHRAAPHGDPEKGLQLQINSIQYNDYVGRIGIGRIYNGKIRTGQQVAIVRRDGTIIKSKLQQLQAFEGLGRKNIEEAAAARREPCDEG